MVEAEAELVMGQKAPFARWSVLKLIVLKNVSCWCQNVTSVVPVCSVRLLVGGENESGRRWKTW